jgi:hypothetical protein
MSEWFKEHAWKVCRLKRPPGFESLSLRHWFGGVAQLGERLVRNEEVSGSSPLISTVLGSLDSVLAVLDGESAVPCNPQSAIAGLNSLSRSLPEGG